MGSGRSWLRGFVGTCLIGTAALSTHAAMAPATPRSMANGAELIDVKDTQTPFAAIVVRFPVGAADDPADSPGLAALMGRLMEQASTRHVRQQDRDDLIRAMGFSPWQPKVLAYRDRTVLRELVPAGAVRLGLWLASDRAAYFSDGIDGASVADATSDIAQQKQQLDDEPYSALWDRAQTEAFGPGDCYGHGIDMAALRRLSPAELRQRARRLYGVDHAVIAVYGADKPASVHKWVEQYFGSLPRTRLDLPPRRHPPPAPRRFTMKADVKYPAIALSWRTAAYFTQDDQALDIAARVLSRRLRAELVGRHIARSVGARQDSSSVASAFAVEAVADTGHDVGELRAAIEQQIQALAGGNIDGADLGSAQRLLAVETATLNDTLDDRASFATNCWALKHDPGYYTTYQKRYTTLTAEQVASAVKRELPLNRRTEGILTPGKPAAASPRALKPPPSAAARPLPPPADQEFRYAPPGAASRGRFSLPVADDVHLRGGARLLFLARPGSDLVRVSAVLRWRDKPPCCDAFELMTSLLPQSHLGNNGQSLAGAARRAGAVFDAVGNYNNDAMWVDFAVRPQDLDQAVKLGTGALLVHDLDAKEFGRMKQQMRQRKLSSFERLEHYLLNSMVPARHRYHLPLPGGAADKLSLVELSRYLRKQAVASQVTYVVTGDTTLGAVQKALGPAEKRLRKQAAPKSRALHANAGAFLFDDPQQKEVDVSVNVPLPGWDDPDLAVGLLAPYFFEAGSWFDSHLSALGIKDHGPLTTNSWLPAELPFAHIECSVPPDDVAAFVKGVFDEMQKLRSGTVPQDELIDAQRGVLEWLRKPYSDAASAHHELVRIATRGATPDVDEELYRRAKLVDVAAVQRFAKQYLLPDHATVVAYGPVNDAREPLEKLGLKVSLRSAKGKGAKP